MSKVEKQKMRTAKKNDLSDRVKGKEKAYVLFYATWCPFSQRFLPIFQEYAEKNPEECLSARGFTIGKDVTIKTAIEAILKK